MAVTITFVAINVNTLNRGGVVSVGEVAQPGWAQHGKNNFGNGNMYGVNIETNIVNNVLDSDLVDSPISDVQNTPSFQNQTV